MAIVILVGAREFVAHHHGYEVEWRETPIWELNGADQFHVFGYRYVWFTVAMAAFALTASVIALFGETQRLRFWKDRRLILELYFISFCATALLPENLHTDPTGGWIGALVTRLTLISAMLAFCWLASLPVRAWYLAFSAICAAVFFTFIYQDTGFLNRMEASTRRITQQLPFGTRTLSTIFCSQRLPHHLSPYSRSRVYRSLLSGFELRAVHEAVSRPCPAGKSRGYRVGR